MRWLTRGWWAGDGEGNADEYRRRLQEIRPELPAAVRRLTELDLHDAYVLAWDFDDGDGVVRLHLYAGDAACGYVRVALTYSGAELFGATRAEAETWLSDEALEVLHDEVDLHDGLVEHRFLLWPEGELGIRFEALEIEVRPAAPEYRLEHRGGRPLS
ncbi:MAG TPA: hypothetical protein VHN37_09695 [Actinomycetota bacterium]|nr:hypothetical protein [Actinomycetota bacterium]